MRASGDPASMALVESSKQEAKQGDRLIPTAVDDSAQLLPESTVGHRYEGQIIAVVGGVTQIGQYQVVVLNRGTSHGLGSATS